ncbi:hypothetical protein TSIB_1945 [Thermococcus sibiricus MM 739]|uniref:Uncharacterized protein n=1 Tax=Thermococcus sibiricus (strain DSM 12597 / MM 739) TaxID=604354 RepID=C6A013_THESM|nr:hypothetical protein TSIB_1945 [Thermococcus sibiricus MM 739]
MGIYKPYGSYKGLFINLELELHPLFGLLMKGKALNGIHFLFWKSHPGRESLKR